MDELSPEAREFLKLARREHEVPNDQVAGRVRAKVAAAVLLTDPSLLGTAKLKAGGVFTHGALAKLGAGALAVSVAAGGALLMRDARPVDAVPRAPAASAVAASSAASATEQPIVGETAGSLQAELKLLERASDRLAGHDVDGCLGALAEHRQRFPRALLVEEREGLELLARCMRAPQLARAQAQQFVTQHPGAMLNVRIRVACKLEKP